MITTTTEKMLKNRDLRNGVIHVIIDELKSWDYSSTQSKIELDAIEMIECGISSNFSRYFDDFQYYFITNNFRSCGDFLNNFYKANPEISIIVNTTLYEGAIPIKLILEGRKLEDSLDDYYEIFNIELKTLKRLVE